MWSKARLTDVHEFEQNGNFCLFEHQDGEIAKYFYHSSDSVQKDRKIQNLGNGSLDIVDFSGGEIPNFWVTDALLVELRLGPEQQLQGSRNLWLGVLGMLRP